MSYPNYKNKHFIEIEEGARGGDHIAETNKWKGKIPSSCIITYQSEPFNFWKEKFAKEIKPLNPWTLWGCQAFYNDQFVFVKMHGVGAPHAVFMFEELIDLGIKNFINIGTAGGLQKP